MPKIRMGSQEATSAEPVTRRLNELELRLAAVEAVLGAGFRDSSTLPGAVAGDPEAAAGGRGTVDDGRGTVDGEPMPEPLDGPAGPHGSGRTSGETGTPADRATDGSAASGDESAQTALSRFPVSATDLRRRYGKPGGVLAVAAVRLPRGTRVSWHREAPTETLLDDDWGEAAERLAALAHPVRLRLLREVLRGVRSVAALSSLPGLGSSGQLYHHLRPLLAEGWLSPVGRGRYEVPEHRVGPLLAIITAAAPDSPR